MQQEARRILYGQDARNALLQGAKIVYEAVRSTYGASGGNVVIQKEWGDPVLTRDGVTVAKDVDIADKAQNQGAKLIKQASKKTNDRAGDGTSATVVLAYHILDEANRLVATGYNPMEIRKQILSSVEYVKNFIDSNTQPVTDKKLVEVATIACGDDQIGKLIADTVIQVGESGGVTIEEHMGISTEREMVEGFYFDRGFCDFRMITNFAALKAEHTDMPILITKKRINTNAQIVPLIEKTMQSTNRKIMIVGEISGEALETLIVNKQQGKIDALAVAIPNFGDMEHLFLEDVALMTGGRVIEEAENMDKVTLDDLGLAGKVISTENTTTILDGDGDLEQIELRIRSIKDRMKEETNTLYQERLEMRLAKLTGKIAVIRVGASSDVAREELKFRVEDAVNATQNARKEGIVAGGGTTLLFAAQNTPKDFSGILKKALPKCYDELLSNAGEDAGYRRELTLQAGYGHGYNLRNMTTEPIDLFKAGIIDPALTLKQVVENAAEVAGNIVTAGCVMVFEDKKEEDKSNGQPSA